MTNKSHETLSAKHEQQYFDYMRLERSVSETLADITYNKQLFMSQLPTEEVRELMIKWQDLESYQRKQQMVKNVE